MGLFKSKNVKELDDLLNRVVVNMSNNYKDAAQADFAAFEKAFLTMKEEGVLKDKVLAKYQAQYEEYQEKLKGYTHKDQKPYWT